MPVPPELERKIAEGLKIVDSDPQHHLDWHFRQEMYSLFGSYDDSVVKRARGWLGVLVAEKVIPILESAPVDIRSDLPQRTMDISLKLLNNVLPREPRNQYSRLKREWYFRFGYWSPDEVNNCPINAGRAFNAVYLAFLEVVDPTPDPFEDSEKHQRVSDSSDKPLSVFTSRVVPNSIPGNLWTDFEWAHCCVCADSARLGATAYAGNADDRECDPQKLEEFWKWWLLEAIPKAWELAEISPNQSTE